MSLLGGIGNWLRKEVDNAGSFITGQPAHSPPPQAPNPINIQQRVAPGPQIQINNTPNPQQIALNGPSTHSGISLPQPGNPNHPNTWGTPIPPHPNLVHQGAGLINRNIVRPISSADQYVSNMIGLGPALQASNSPGGFHTPISQQINKAENFGKSIVTMPIHIGQQLGNTGLQLTHTIPNDLPGTTPSLQHQYSQTKKTNGSLPAALETGISGITDIASLVAPGIKGAPKAAEATKAIKEAPAKIAAKDPRVLAYDHQYGQLQKAYDNAGSANLKLNLNKAMANNRLAREQTFKSINQGGYAKLPGVNEPSETPSGANRETQLQPAPQLPLRIQSQAKDLPIGTKLLQSREIDRPKQSASANYTINKTKVEIPQVNPGDYGKARSNAQLVSQPIEYAAGQVARTARNLKLSTSKLGRLVEGTDKPANAAETEAVRRYRLFADRVHATSQSLGGNTPYRPDYFHHEWDLSNPADASKFEAFRQRKFGQDLDPTQFQGLDTQPRVFDTVAEGEKAGFKLKNEKAADDILDYGKGSAYALKRQALAKGFIEADSTEQNKPHSFDIGQGKTIALSDNGLHEIRAFDKTPQAGKPLKVYRGANRKLKQTLLSASEFHPINITKKAAPGLALEGHPVLAAKGAYGAFRAQVGRGYSDRLQQQAFENGTVDAAARIGTPIKFGSDYATEGQVNLGHAGLGEKTIFEKSMPALHIRMVQGLVKDLKSKNIPLDSPEARAAGTRINEIMGFVNTEVRNLDKGHQKFLGDVLLAPQFTRAKWATVKSALKDKGVAGSYARRAVIGDTLATATTILALGYLAKQKSDSTKDMIIRSIVHPSVPTPVKDSKGNTIELGLPSTYSSEALGLVANIKRDKDGHLGISFSPKNVPGNVANYGRARLAIVPGSGLKVATNTDYANKPLFDPNAPTGTKVQQGATTLLGGTLPIGTQGALETNAIKQHLPQAVQQVLTANTPGSNPLVKSAVASFGLTPRTDKTVGKGLQTNQYFSALDQAKSGLNRQEKDAIDLYSGSKKNPVTGAYDVQPSVDDQRAKATTLLQNPKVIDHLITMNQQLADSGQAVDPLWQQPKDKIVKYLQYQSMPPAGPDQIDWRNKNPWYSQGTDSLSAQRSAFFNSLPPGDPNKPKAPIEYPTPDPQTTNDLNTYFSMSDPVQKAQFLASHPNVSDQFDKQADYNNQLRVAQGYGALRTYPKPNAHVQAILDAMPQGNDPASRKARAMAYQDPQVAQWAQDDAVYNLTKGAAVAQIQGNSLTSKDLKAMQSLQYDIVKNPDGSLSLMYGDSQGGAGATPVQPGAISIKSSSSGGRYSKSKKKPMFFRKKPKVIKVRRPHKARKVYLSTPRNPIKVRNQTTNRVKITKSYL